MLNSIDASTSYYPQGLISPQKKSKRFPHPYWNIPLSNGTKIPAANTPKIHFIHVISERKSSLSLRKSEIACSTLDSYWSIFALTSTLCAFNSALLTASGSERTKVNAFVNTAICSLGKPAFSKSCAIVNVSNATTAIKISELNSTAAIIAYSHDLTVLPNSDYDKDIAASTANRFDTLDNSGAEPPELTKSRGFFYMRRTANCFMVGRVGEPQGSPVPLFWCIKPVRSAPPLDTGMVEKLNSGALPC